MRRVARIGIVAFAAILVALTAILSAFTAIFPERASAEIRWFRSDAIGLAIEPIPAFRADEFPWVLAVERSAADGGWAETRRLLNGGSEQRRWTIVRSAEGRTEEREERDGTVTARRLTGAGGELLQEERFAAAALESRSVYEYASGRLERVRVFAADGSLSSTVEYRIAPSGRLREVRWTEADGSFRTASQAAGGTATVVGGAAVSEERTREGDLIATTRFDEAGRVAIREQIGPGGLLFRQRLAYAGDAPTPVSATTEWPAEKKVVETSYDASGSEIAETTTVADAVTARVTWTRDEAGRALVMRREGRGGTEEVRSTWATDGTLAREEYFVRGARVKNVIHETAGERVEELFDGGELFLRVRYRGDTRLREEAVVGGRIVRERVFEP